MLLRRTGQSFRLAFGSACIAASAATVGGFANWVLLNPQKPSVLDWSCERVRLHPQFAQLLDRDVGQSDGVAEDVVIIEDTLRD